MHVLYTIVLQLMPQSRRYNVQDASRAIWMLQTGIPQYAADGLMNRSQSVIVGLWQRF